MELTCSPIVEKPDESDRFCYDFRKLNAVTISDTFPLPRIDDTLEQNSSPPVT